VHIAGVDDPAEVVDPYLGGDLALKQPHEGLHGRFERLLDAVEEIEDKENSEARDVFGQCAHDRRIAESLEQIGEKGVQVRNAAVVRILDLVEEGVDRRELRRRSGRRGERSVGRKDEAQFFGTATP